MTTITPNAELTAVLANLQDLTEIRDSAGNLVGFFTPASHQQALMYARARAHFDPIEMKRRAQSDQQCFTTREVLEHLKSLETT